MLSVNLNWVANVSRPDDRFSVCEACTKFKCARIRNVLYVHKMIINVKY